jgi:hypothetical protein
MAFCADKQIVSGAPPGDSGVDGGGSGGETFPGVCTKACCTSYDCDRGSACFATGAGGNYCVPSAALGDRATTEAGTFAGYGGVLCDAGASCRSGLCAPAGFCADTCCSAKDQPARLPPQCAMGMSCRLGPFQGSMSDMAYVPRCAPQAGSTGNGVSCTSNSDCRSNLCVNDPMGFLTCRDPCRKPEDCGASGMFQTCEYVQLSGASPTANSDLVAACVPLLLPPTMGPDPADAAADWGPCKQSTDCARGYCAVNGNNQSVCVSVCFGDGDCVLSGTCRPQTLQVEGTLYNVLACK